MLLQHLPAELQLQITSYLPRSDLAAMCRVSRLYQEICTKPLYSQCGDLALLWSVKMGVERTFQLALRYGPDVDCVDEESSTPLHIAALLGRPSMAERLVAKGASMSPRDEYFRTPMHVAIENGYIQIVQLLLRHGAYVNNPHGDIHVEPCLIYASRSGHVDIIQLLLDHGADVSATSENQESALGVACYHGHLEAARLFLKHGIDPEEVDRDRNSPLYAASSKGHSEVVEALLEVIPDASLNGRNNDGWTPLHAAARKGHLGIVRMLVERGAHVRALHNYLASPLFCAVTGQKADVCKYLIEKCADVNEGDDNGNTPLAHAVIIGDFEITKLLLDHGADVAGTTRRYGETCLHLACYRSPDESQSEIVKLLVQYGAGVTIKNRVGESPIDLAISKGHDEIVSFLQELGCVPTPRDNVS